MNAFYSELVKQPPVGIPGIPPHLNHPEQVTQFGQTVLWVGFAGMSVGVLALFATTFRAQYRYRLLHVAALLVNIFAAISYYAMASGVGKVLVHSPGHHSTVREVFYARYIDWAFTTPLLLLDLTLVAGLPAGEIAIAIIADIIMIVTGAIGALHPSLKYRWGFFTFSMLAFVYVLWSLVGSARSSAFLRHPKVGKMYNGISLALIVLWSAYPVVWVLGEGLGRVTADTEVLLYAVLDLSAKPVWGLALLLAMPDEGHVLLPEWMAAPGGALSGGGYGSVPSGNDA